MRNFFAYICAAIAVSWCLCLVLNFSLHYRVPKYSGFLQLVEDGSYF